MQAKDLFKKLVRLSNKVAPGLLRSLGWEVLLALISFPASILLNRALGAEERGVLTLTTLIPTTIFTLSSCQWERILQGLITSKQLSGKEAWRKSVYYVVCLSLIFIPIGVISSLLFDKLSFNSRLLSILYCFNLPIYLLGGYLSSIYIALGSIDGLYWMRIGLQGSYLVILFGLFFSGYISVMLIIFTYFTIHIISLTIGWSKKTILLNGEILKSRPNLSILTNSFLPYILAVFSARIDLWAFSIFSSTVSIGNYSAITALMMPVSLISNALTNGSTARLNWTQIHLVRRYLIKTTYILLGLLVVLSIGSSTVAPYLICVVLGKSFQGGEWMIPWVATFVTTQAAANQYHSALQLSGNLDSFLKIQTFEPAIRLVLTVAFGWYFSEFGIILGGIISSVIKVSVCLWFYLHCEINDYS